MADPQPTGDQARLEAAEQRYRSLIDHHPDAIFVLNRRGAPLSINPAAEAISGYSLAELGQVQLANFIAPESVPAVLALFNQALSGRSGAAGIVVLHKDGRPVEVRLTLVPMFVDGSVEGAYGIAQDVSAQHALERERAALLERAQQAEQRSALLAAASAALSESLDYEETLGTLATITVPVFADWCAVDILQEDGGVRRIVGSLRAELRERVGQVLQAGEAITTLPERQRAYLRTGRPIFLPELSEVVLHHLTSNEHQRELLRGLGVSGVIRVPLLARASLLGALTFGRAAENRHFTQEDVRFAQDLARRAALAIDNATLFRSAQEAVQARDEFLASASHDLRTPVTTIKAMAQVLEHRLRAGRSKEEDLRQGLNTIDETAGRITVLINELLDLSRLQSGRPLDLERRSCDLVELVRRVAGANEGISAGARIRLDTSLGSLLGLWDPLRLERVLDNLLSNALKYGTEGAEVRVNLARSAPSEGEAGAELAVLSVQDEGIGIPADELPHIFERFYRARNVTGRPGTGIGLAGAREIVQQHGGTIEVASEEGRGTTFTVRLPLAPPD